jgi:hypothetical protein
MAKSLSSFAVVIADAVAELGGSERFGTCSPGPKSTYIRKAAASASRVLRGVPDPIGFLLGVVFFWLLSPVF